MQGMKTLARLQRWYQSRCNGDWEHNFGINIGTLDNPGWRVEINLAETTLECVDFVEISVLAPVEAWIRCWVEGPYFHGAGGPGMLETILEHFLDWAEAV